tara:strand:- start:3752 stop:4411 length:660 start_codon:yes stop_codon:yes gene_type:complete
MSILNDKFDKVFVISSHPTYNRLNNINHIFQEFDISYELIISPDKRYFDDYSLIDKKNIWVGSGNKSLISANESILLKSKIEKYKSICVFEDDVFFEKNHLKMLSDFFKELNDDWQILNLGYHAHSNVSVNFSNKVHRIKKDDVIIGTHVICYKENIFDELLTELSKNKYPIDWFLDKTIYYKYMSYIPTDRIFYASSYRRCECDSDADYKLYKSEICF